MSVYIVDREHIRYLVSASLTGPEPMYWDRERLGRDSQDKLTEIGQMLWDANIESVKTCYPDCQKSLDNAPGPVDETFIYAHGGGIHSHLDPVQVIKACNCLEYQSCEYDGWKRSEARKFLDALMSHMVRQLPGYDHAEWGAPRAVYAK